MRPLILIVGIIIIIGGVVLLEEPLSQSGSKTITPTTPAHFHITERVPIQSSQPVTLSWSSNTSVNLVLLTCSSINTSAPEWMQCAGGSNLTETGSSGSATTNVPVGGYLWVVVLGPSTESASVHVTTTLSTEAIGLFGLGALVVIVGLLLRRGKKPVAAAEVPETPPAAPTGVEVQPSPAAPPPTPAESPGEAPLL
jgi:hypothetical protein